MKSDRPKHEEKEEKPASKPGFNLLEKLQRVVPSKLHTEFLGKEAHRISSLNQVWHKLVTEPRQVKLQIKK